jgi:hypothetical protein
MNTSLSKTYRGWRQMPLMRPAMLLCNTLIPSGNQNKEILRPSIKKRPAEFDIINLSPHIWIGIKMASKSGISPNSIKYARKKLSWGHEIP